MFGLERIWFLDASNWRKQEPSEIFRLLWKGATADLTAALREGPCMVVLYHESPQVYAYAFVYIYVDSVLPCIFRFISWPSHLNQDVYKLKSH
jgi:hypothetical protein